MLTHQPLNRALLTAAGAAALLSLTACSSQVKVQKVIYDAPEVVASVDPSLEPSPASFQSATQSTSQPVSYQSSDTVLTPFIASDLTTTEHARQALEDIYDRDAELVAASMQEDPNRIHSLKLIAEYDRQNAETLMTIIERFGWPTREMVGIKAVQGAYIAVQHAGHDAEFQSNCLALIQQQVDQGELPGAFLALMTDRVTVSRGEPQIFGTQMTMAPDEFGVMRAVPSAAIWQSEQLDERRAALGMPAHTRFIEAIEIAYFESVDQSNSQISAVQTD